MPEGSIQRTERCHAITKRRGANTRCKHMTTISQYCWQHEKALRGLRIKTSEIPGAGKGVFTTMPIPKGAIICKYTGDIVQEDDPDYSNPYALQIKERPPTFIDASKTNEPGEGRWVNDGRDVMPNNAELVYVSRDKMGYVKALRDIRPGEEILVDYGEDYPWPDESSKRTEVVPKWRKPEEVLPSLPAKAVVMPAAKPKMKLIKPDHGPDEYPPIVFKDDEPKPAAKKKPVLSKQEKLDLKHEKYIRDRMRVVQDLFHDEKLAADLKVPVSKRVVKMPERGKLDPVAWEQLMEKTLITNKALLVKHFNRNPRNAMTSDKLYDIIEQVIAAEKKGKSKSKKGKGVGGDPYRHSPEELEQIEAFYSWPRRRS